ncbi:hypothetical protein JIN84_12950 [Luteolibacter yonseiensis]|uniref:Uncharacterized protein n=1 Tax=Luteolibacter yonseiensis TaxID=1144680 RepID=A0A934R534_9BACT|nr:hypothetical protein [Luteolibacter yonseiensis]MBK1816527.1 hypothetical protein [Luteolibacter yonseiensis]
MKIKFIRSVLHKGEHQEQGTVVDLPDGEAKFFLVAGDAVESDEKEEKKPK